ncbi:hypothetical protein RD055328_12900 [Companilactobacillus sp. RD055328]|uniref:DUF4352 domain-containing protein n=1 Tax=Companilactobacillus sp. RD055328 TaxID=2916634 RepID=UPI001FC881D3|nr:DUF4352 domain-containing protein [Companilactobacillus sp. RD055328]GKQ43367.1 hypothetical protein RD055328_12900 [Companilactobacillus sp. RD055328]
MRKIFYFVLSVLTVATIAGCSNAQSQKASDDQGQLNVMKKTKEIQITPVKISDDSEKGKNKIVKIKYSIKNTSKKEVVVGASDFIIKSGESYYYMGEGINFAETIKPGKETTGNGYYEMPKDLNKFTLIYHPVDSKSDLRWNIKIKE